MVACKVSQASGPALDWMVAKALGFGPFSDGISWLIDDLGVYKQVPRYSTDWSQGGPIIEQEGGTLWATVAAGWRCKARYDYAKDAEGPTLIGPTALTAAMRCFVVSRLGDVVEIPEELLS